MKNTPGDFRIVHRMAADPSSSHADDYQLEQYVRSAFLGKQVWTCCIPHCSLETLVARCRSEYYMSNEAIDVIRIVTTVVKGW